MPGMLDHVSVSAYGDAMPLQHLATTNVRDTSTLVVNVYDKQVKRKKADGFQDVASLPHMELAWRGMACD